MKLTDQLIHLHRLYISQHGKHPDMVIMDEVYHEFLLEEINESGLPDFLEDISITIVPRMGKSEVRFYKRLNLLKLSQSTKEVKS